MNSKQTDSIKKNVKQTKKVNTSVKILTIILFLLVILSLSVLLVRIGNILPNNVDIFFIEPKVESTEISDEDQIWGMDTQIDIFSISYSNEKGEIIVESSGGEKIIAPGMSGNYKFQIKNMGNIAVDTKTIVRAEFRVENLEYTTLPILLRLTDYEGNNLSNNGWVSVDKFEDCVSELTIGKNSYIYYTLDWRWDFESGDDEFDTLLGNLSVDSVVELHINIVSSATQCENYEAEGGLTLNEDEPRTGGNLVPAPYIVLNLIILIIIIILISLQVSKTKKQSQKIKDFVKK